ncbi:site-specific integrase [soil metagenome]
MTSIRKRAWTAPTGEEKTAWLVDYKDSAGKRRAKTFARKKDAEAWLTKAAYDVSQGVHTADSQSITMEKAGELWLKRAKRENLETSTYNAYEQHVRLHINPMCGDKKLSQLSKPIVEGYRDQLMERLSRPMALRVLRSLTSIIDGAQSAGYVAQNVASSVKVRRSKREKPQITIPTKDELRTLIAAAKELEEGRVLPLVLIATFAGLRASEMRGLCWRHIDFKAASVTVSQRADLKNIIGPPKSEAGNRTIPLPPSVVQALREWKLACPKSDEDLVFPSIAKKVMTHRFMLMNVMAPLQVGAGVHDVGTDKGGQPVKLARYTMHDFRHAAASLWIEQRVNPKRVQRWMGHSSIQVTFDVYGHLFDQADEDGEVAAAVEREIFGKPDATQMQHGA